MQRVEAGEINRKISAGDVSEHELRGIEIKLRHLRELIVGQDMRPLVGVGGEVLLVDWKGLPSLLDSGLVESVAGDNVAGATGDDEGLANALMKDDAGVEGALLGGMLVRIARIWLEFANRDDASVSAPNNRLIRRLKHRDRDWR